MSYRILTTTLLVLLFTGCSSDSDTSDADANGDVINVDTLTEDGDIALPLRDLDDVGFEMIADLAGYKADQLAGVVADLSAIIADNAIGLPEVLDGGEFLTLDSLEGFVSSDTQRTLYLCSGGGSLIHETGSLQLNFNDYSHTRDVNRYEFDQCQFFVITDRAPMGVYSANGVLSTSDRSLTQRRTQETSAQREWTTFELNGPDELRYEVAGSNEWAILQSPGGTTESRQSGFTSYRKTQGDTVIDSMSDSRFDMNLSLLGGNNANTMTLEFNGAFEDERSSAQLISINTTSPLTFSANTSSQLLHSGAFEIQASDGRFMSGSAMSSGDRSNPSIAPLVDWTSTDIDGAVTSDIATQLGSFSAYIEQCDTVSTEQAGLCVDGSYPYLLP